MHTEPDKQRTTVTPRLISMPATGTALTLTLMDPAHARRAFAETFVGAIFRRAYGATLTAFYPLLLGLTRDDGEYAAVAGIRPAGAEALFSEHYLDRPVEQLLTTGRAGIAEIGNLAPANAGQARWLICTLSAFLMGAGFTHVVFTSVPKLRNAFARMGLPLTGLLSWFVVGYGLAPLRRLAIHLRDKRADDLGPLPFEEQPRELLQVVTSINDLLRRLDASFRR
ncbi:MAG: thermostable hemolysin, partial [Gammaproteobacteria bacterium]